LINHIKASGHNKYHLINAENCFSVYSLVYEVLTAVLLKIQGLSDVSVRKLDGGMWTGLIQLRRGTSGKLL
jgi:hypothetical protein